MLTRVQKNLIDRIVNITKDYRQAEGYPISHQRVEKWVSQFHQKDRGIVLQETGSMLHHCYFSKRRIAKYILHSFEKLRKLKNHTSICDLMDNSVLLRTQAKDKSQTRIIEDIIGEVLQYKYNYNIESCGTKSKVNLIYIDDVLCTGNTFYRDLKGLVSSSSTLKKKLQQGDMHFYVFYCYLIKEQFEKKLYQLNRNTLPEMSNYITHSSFLLVNRHDLVRPVESKTPVPSKVQEYMQFIKGYADKVAMEGGYNSYSPMFYRSPQHNVPYRFYTNKLDGQRYENILLEMGVDILRRGSIRNFNMKPLGYSLPSYKDFGLGVLAFTWRNVPNNAPLVFWYSSNGFFPLFEKNATSSNYE